MPRYGIGFSEATLRQLREVVADATRSTKETVTERSWIGDQINQLCATYALPWRQLEGNGRWQAGNMPPPMGAPIYVTVEDLREFRLAPSEEGFALALGEKTVARIERAAAMTAARNKALGAGAVQPWATANEWLEMNLTDRIAQARAQLDMKEMMDEQKAQQMEDQIQAERQKRLAESLGPEARRKAERTAEA